MTNKIITMALGFILIFGGIFYFFRDSIPISYGSVCSIIIGCAFIGAYFKKNRRWTILPGIYLLYIGIAAAFFANSHIFNYIITSVFFLAPGTIFTILYYTTDNRRPLLTLGLVLISVGVCVLFIGIFDFHYINIFLLCIGIAFVINYVLGKDYGNRTSLVIGIILILLSLRRFLSITGYADAIISMILVILGFIVIVRALLVR